jgi:hypothetical protein
MQKLAINLKKNEIFRIKGKRKIYKIEDIFLNYDYFSVLVYYRISSIKFGKIKINKNQIVITNEI